MNKIYLAGPIAGITFDDATEWRDSVSKLLNTSTTKCFSPLRGKEYLKGSGVLSNGTYDGTMTSQKGIMGRDYFDCTTATLVIFNLLDTKRVSIGTMMELAWCYQKQIPTIVIMEEQGNLHDHVMVREAITYRVKTIDEAIVTAKILLNEQLPKSRLSGLSGKHYTTALRSIARK